SVARDGLVDEAVACAAEIERPAQCAILALIGVRSPHFAPEFETVPPSIPGEIVDELEQRTMGSRSAQIIRERLPARSAKAGHANDGKSASELVLDHAVRQPYGCGIDRRPARDRITLAIEAKAEFVDETSAKKMCVCDSDCLPALRVRKRECGQRGRSEKD